MDSQDDQFLMAALEAVEGSKVNNNISDSELVSLANIAEIQYNITRYLESVAGGTTSESQTVNLIERELGSEITNLNPQQNNFYNQIEIGQDEMNRSQFLEIENDLLLPNQSPSDINEVLSQGAQNYIDDFDMGIFSQVNKILMFCYSNFLNKIYLLA